MKTVNEIYAYTFHDINLAMILKRHRVVDTAVVTVSSTICSYRQPVSNFIFGKTKNCKHGIIKYYQENGRVICSLKIEMFVQDFFQLNRWGLQVCNGMDSWNFFLLLFVFPLLWALLYPRYDNTIIHERKVMDKRKNKTNDKQVLVSERHLYY